MLKLISSINRYIRNILNIFLVRKLYGRGIVIDGLIERYYKECRDNPDVFLLPPRNIASCFYYIDRKGKWYKEIGRKNDDPDPFKKVIFIKGIKDLIMHGVNGYGSITINGEHNDLDIIKVVRQACLNK